LLVPPPLRELVDRVPERLGVGEQRRDVFEADALLRPVRDLADFLGEIHPIMLTQAGAARARKAVVTARRRRSPALPGLRCRSGGARGFVIAAPARRPGRSGPLRDRRPSGTSADASAASRSGR